MSEPPGSGLRRIIALLHVMMTSCILLPVHLPSPTQSLCSFLVFWESLNYCRVLLCLFVLCLLLASVCTLQEIYAYFCKHVKFNKFIGLLDGNGFIGKTIVAKKPWMRSGLVFWESPASCLVLLCSLASVCTLPGTNSFINTNTIGVLDDNAFTSLAGGSQLIGLADGSQLIGLAGGNVIDNNCDTDGKKIVPKQAWMEPSLPFGDTQEGLGRFGNADRTSFSTQSFGHLTDALPLALHHRASPSAAAAPPGGSLTSWIPKLLLLFLILSSVPSACAAIPYKSETTHSLIYNVAYSKCVDRPGNFTATSLLDDTMIASYDSKVKGMVPTRHWVELRLNQTYWGKLGSTGGQLKQLFLLAVNKMSKQANRLEWRCGCVAVIKSASLVVTRDISEYFLDGVKVDEAEIQWDRFLKTKTDQQGLGRDCGLELRWLIGYQREEQHRETCCNTDVNTEDTPLQDTTNPPPRLDTLLLSSALVLPLLLSSLFQ